MARGAKLFAIIALVAIVTGCATAAGGMIGTGIGSASGNTSAGILIGSGVGMMIDMMK